MAQPAILLTSFRPWRAHQAANSSDELIAALRASRQLPENSLWIRDLPVSFELAPALVISQLCQYRPRTIVCCGMAENRAHLSIEQQAMLAGKCLQTTVNLQRLLHQTLLSEVSYDAGSYVCNELYYRVLESIQRYRLPTTAVFAHIPILSAERKRLVMADFLKIINRLAV